MKSRLGLLPLLALVALFSAMVFWGSDGSWQHTAIVAGVGLAAWVHECVTRARRKQGAPAGA